jgi:hypothetical protein
MISASVGDSVVISNPKHKLYMKRGKVTRIDRGNVWVKVGEKTICTRSASLEKK